MEWGDTVISWHCLAGLRRMPENKDVCRLSLWLRRKSVFLQALQRLGIVCIQTYRGTNDSTPLAQRAEPETRNISTSGKTNLGDTTICPGLEGQGVEGGGEWGISIITHRVF